MRISTRRIGPVIAAFALLTWAGAARPHAQEPGAAPSVTQPEEQRQVYRTTGSRIAVGRTIHIAEDEEVTDAVVVLGGSVRIDGRVQDGVVVLGGNVDLGPRADVRGDVVVVGGQLTRANGARLHGSVSDVTFGDWWAQTFGTYYWPRFDFGGLGRWLSLLGAVFRISALAVMMAFVLLVARAPVARVGRSAGAEPLRAFFIGVAAEILFLPALIMASIGLIVTIIGIPFVALLVPVSLFTLFVALILGFTSISCRIGEWVEDRFGWRANNAFLATALGLFLIVGPTMVSRMVSLGPWPIRTAALALLLTGVLFEYVMWTVGLGATLMTGFGRWSTAPPPVPPVPQGGIVAVIG